MRLRHKNHFLLLVVLVIGLLFGLALAGLPQVAQAIAAPTATPAVPDPRPEPPAIEAWGIPDPAGGEPAECAGQPGCGVMCYYIAENAAANEFELSCMAWIFE